MAESTGEERDVRALERAYDEAWTSGDLAQLLSFFIPDAVIVTADVAIVEGRAVLDTHAAQAIEEDHSLLHSFSDVVVKRDGAWRISQVRAYGFIS